METQTIGVIDGSQKKAARVAGFMYLFLMTTGILGFSLRAGLILPGDHVRTAAHILASERLFRVSTFFDLVTAAGEAVLAVALYALLKRVNRTMALLAALWRVTDGAILAAITLGSFVLLLLLHGDRSMQAFTAEQLQSLASLSYNAEGAGFTIGFLFLALGNIVFTYLFLKSRYIPKALATLGICSYVVMLGGTAGSIIFPEIAKVALTLDGPAGIFEVVAGFWLLVKGVEAPNWGWFSRAEQ